MAQANYKITIADHDYHSTTYVTYVSASSKTMAIAKAAALAGAEKTVREWRRTGRHPAAIDACLTEPDIKMEPASLDEFWDHQDEVLVEEH